MSVALKLISMGDLGIDVGVCFVHCQIAKRCFLVPFKIGNNNKHGNWFIL